MSRWEEGLRIVAFSLAGAWFAVFAVDRWGEGLTLFVLAFNGIPALLAMVSWRSTSLLRFLRLVCAAAVAAGGALLTLYLGSAGQGGEVDAGTVAALAVAVGAGVAGTWAADLTVARRADAEAKDRHRELLERVVAGAAPASPTKPSGLRVRDVVLLAIAARIVRR